MFGTHYLVNLYIILVVVMANIDGNIHLDLHLRKALRYENHQENFKESLSNDVTPFGLRIKMTPAIVTFNEKFQIKWYSILKNAEKQRIKLLLFKSKTMVDKMQFMVVMLIKGLFPNDQGKVNNILRDKNRNIKKQLKQRRQKKWKKFIDWPNYGYYSTNENPGEKSVIEPTQIIERMQSVDNVRSKLHKTITIPKEKNKSYAEILRGYGSRNNEGLSFSEKFLPTEDVSKS